jgi:hypothetical protein
MREGVGTRWAEEQGVGEGDDKVRGQPGGGGAHLPTRRHHRVTPPRSRSALPSSRRRRSTPPRPALPLNAANQP